MKVPQILKLWQQMWRPEQQAETVSTPGKNCEIQDKQQSLSDDSSMGKRNYPPPGFHGMGVNIRKCSITQLVEAQPDGHRAWPRFPRRPSLQVMGEGCWQGSLRGSSMYSCWLKIRPLINRTQPQGGVMPALSPALTERAKSRAQENSLCFKDQTL